MKGVIITMLILCPECQLQVSDKAISCPHCGYPLKPDKISRQSSKRMRLPNGFGQITEIKNRNLRNRFRAMITDGKTEEGRPIQKMLKPQAFFPTYKEAYEALIEYHKNPYEPEKDLTMQQVYDKWIEKQSEEVTAADSLKQYKSAWLYCSSIKDMKIKDIRSHHIKDCINYGTKISGDGEIESSPQKKNKIKIMFNLLFDYALEYEYVDKNYARAFKLGKNIKDSMDESLEHHIVFTDEEIATLWQNINDPIVKFILVQCYMGWRPQELCELKLENVHDKYIIGGMKTKNGKDRQVPIPPRIAPIIEEYKLIARTANLPYLFNLENRKAGNRPTQMSYSTYYKNFAKVLLALNINPEHKPHDGRKHFVTAAKKAGVNEYAIKRIIGHSIIDVTEVSYTERDIDWLYEEVCRIP